MRRGLIGLILAGWLLGKLIAGAGAQTSSPLVGAIRWDGWFRGNPWERNLDPLEWRSRLPFYAKTLPDGRVEVRSDEQTVMDQEISYAARAGLSFWAFCYYHPSSWKEADHYNYGWKLYLCSPQKRALNFCLLLQGGTHMGPREEWEKTAAQFIALFREPTYQRVAGSRPLVFIFACEYLEPQFGSKEAARKALADFREQSKRAGTGDPYLVTLVFNAQVGAGYVNDLGFDAISAYSAPGSGDHREYPYSDLISFNRDYWESFRATGKAVIPTVNAGWDGRPRLRDPQQAKHYRGPWYAMPTPAQLAENLRAALEWNRAHAAVNPAGAVLIYAWNETDEGGWLVPTLAEGTARLDAIRSVLKSKEKR